MVVRFRKKKERQRGKRWHGWGSKKKHRGKGSKGGRGWGGSHKHKWSYITTYAKDHYGYKGFIPPRKKLERKRKKEINLDQLNELASRLGKTDIDLNEMGYTKLLSRGQPDKPLTIKIHSASGAAKNKIEKIGGKVLIG